MSIRLAVFGLFGSANFGNEATLAAFLHGVRARLPGCEILCVAPRQSQAEVMHRVATTDMLPLPVSPWLWRLGESKWRGGVESMLLRLTEGRRIERARTALADCSALVVPGTGVVDDFGQGPDDMPLHLDRWTAAAQRDGIALNFVSIGASRVSHLLSRKRFRRALERADSCTFRDAVSQSNAVELGFSHPAVVRPDLAFSLPPSWLPAVRPDWPPRTIGLGVMGYRGWNLSGQAAEAAACDYAGRLTDLAKRLLAAGYCLRLLTGDSRADNAARDAVADSLAPTDDSLVVPPIRDFRDLLTELGHCDLVVATRYHNLLLALASGRPVISLGYADKNDALLADFGEQRCGRAIDDFDPCEVAAAVGQLASEPALHHKLTAKAAQFRALLEAQYDTLAAAWLQRVGSSTAASRQAVPSR